MRSNGATLSRASRLVTTMLVAAVLVVLRPMPAHAAEWYEAPTAQWYDGGISYSQVLNCYSVISGAPTYEYGIGAYAGYVADPGAGHPAVGDHGYIRYTVYGLGNPCPGGSYFRPTFYLPPGMEWDTARPIACGYDGQGATAPAQACPGWDHMDASDTYTNNMSGDSGTLWGVAQGHHWEFQLPVTTSQTLTNFPLQIHLNVADGNHNPTMLLEAPVYVFGSSNGGGGGTGTGAVSVMYDNPSSTATATLPWNPSLPSHYGMASAFQAVVNGRGGTARFEIGTDPTLGTLIGYDELAWPANTYTGINVATDWEPASTATASIPTLTPGVTYYWRGKITPTGESTVTGAIQSFVLKAGGGVATSEPITSTTGGSAGGLGSGGTLGGGLTPVPVPTPTTPPPTTSPEPTPTQPPTPAAPVVVAAANLSVPAKAKAAKGVRATVTCSGACSGQLKLTVSKKVAKALKLRSTTLGTAKVGMSAGGSSVVTVKLSRKAKAAVTKAGKAKATVGLSVTLAGKTLTSTRAVKLTG